MSTPAARRRIAPLLALVAAAGIAALAFSGDDASDVFAGELDRTPRAQLASLCAQPYVVVRRPDPILLERELPILADAMTPRVSALELAPVPHRLRRVPESDPNLWKRLREALGSVTYGSGRAEDNALSPARVVLDAEACNQ